MMLDILKKIKNMCSGSARPALYVPELFELGTFMNIQLRQEVREWCDENMEGRYTVVRMELGDNVWAGADSLIEVKFRPFAGGSWETLSFSTGGKEIVVSEGARLQVPAIQFIDDSDLVLFRLRWGDHK